MMSRTSFKEYIYKKLGYCIRPIDMSLHLNMDRSETVCKWFRGQTYPSQKHLGALAGFLKIDPIQLKLDIFDIKKQDIANGN